MAKAALPEMEDMTMEDKPMTGEEVLQEIIGLLNGNGMQQSANGVYELCAYVDSMTKQMQEMTEELISVKKQIEEMKEDTFTNNLKKSLSEAADRLENRCNEIKAHLFEVKESIKNKAKDIIADFKMRGKEALNRVSEFVGLKEKLTHIRDKVKEGIADTEKTISKLDAFGVGMRETGQKIANTFRTFADKEEVDYSQKEKQFSKTELAKKPWKWQLKVYQNMELRLDGAIDKVEDLARDVELNKSMSGKPEPEKESMTPMSMVAEPSEYQYGSDAFEAAMKEKGLNVMPVSQSKVPIEKKVGKSR